MVSKAFNLILNLDSMFPENFLIAERISNNNQAGSKKRVLEETGKLLSASSLALRQEMVFDKLLEREHLGSTGLGHGIALPHARIPGIQDAIGAFIQLASTVDFEAIDNQPVDLVFGLLVPEDATREHLQLLAELARLFGDTEFCDRLRRAQDAETILREILGSDRHT